MFFRHVKGGISLVSTDQNFQDAHNKLRNAKIEIAKVIFGQEDVIDQTLVTLASGGHVLLIGLPGVAKTLLVETTAQALGLSSNRIQCTPDLMPNDVLGSEVLEEDGKGKRSFRFIEGPVFAQLLMADEINRASPRTQSALLQAMQEHEISVGGKKYSLPAPFHVMATQNPLEHEGTYPLPEAQLDRFMMEIDMHYPDRETERDVMLSTTSNKEAKVKAAMKGKDLLDIHKLVRDMPVGESVVDGILDLVRHARPETTTLPEVKDYVSWAPGPRASQALMLAVRAQALLDGREAPSMDDVAALAKPILKHRMALNYKARAEGLNICDLIERLVRSCS